MKATRRSAHRRTRRTRRISRSPLLLGIALVLVLCGTAIYAQSAGAQDSPGSSAPSKPVLDQHAQAIAAARAKHPAKPTNYTPPPPVATPTLVAGIVHTRQGPFPNSIFSVEEVYQGPVGSRWVVVYAGTAWTNYSTAGLGALRVYNVGGGFVGTFSPAIHTSYLDISGVRGTQLQLVADGHTPLTFDLASDRFGTS